MFKVQILKRPPTAAKLMKEILIGASKGINKTATEAQQSVQKAYRQNFTIRNQFLERGPLAIQVKRSNALKGDMTAEVRTRADFLPIHETGGIKTPRGHRLAIPTENVKRTKRDIIQKSQRPRALRAKGSFIINTRKGTEFIVRRVGRGKNQRLQFLYNLTARARIKRVPTFFPVISKVVSRRLNSNVRGEIKRGLMTMK
jgi:hypothetical protein